jgi:hypothetical protein
MGELAHHLASAKYPLQCKIRSVVEVLQQYTGHTHYGTFSKRLATVVSVFKAAPSTKLLSDFVKLLPACSLQRDAQCMEVCKGFWSIVNAAGSDAPVWKLYELLGSHGVLLMLHTYTLAHTLIMHTHVHVRVFEKSTWIN